MYVSQCRTDLLVSGIDLTDYAMLFRLLMSWCHMLITCDGHIMSQSRVKMCNFGGFCRTFLYRYLF